LRNCLSGHVWYQKFRERKFWYQNVHRREPRNTNDHVSNNEGKKTILQIEEQTNSQYSNSPRSKNTNQSKPISKNTEKILNITPLSKKTKKKEGQSVKKGKNSSNIWKQQFTKTKTLFNIKIAPGNSNNNYKLPKNTKRSTYTIHKHTIKREEKAWNLGTCSHKINEKNPPKDDQENVRKIKRTKYKN
jgi:hypothetical protein